MPPSVTSYLGLGSNLGDRAALLAEALRRLNSAPQIHVTQSSSFYETAPVGFTEQPPFLNAVVEITTTLPPTELLAVILQIETQMGRARTFRWGPRVIDIDILLYGDSAVTEPGLTIPHPSLTERAFALAPLVEIAPDACFPNGETAKKKWERLVETGNNFGVRIVKQADPG